MSGDSVLQLCLVKPAVPASMIVAYGLEEVMYWHRPTLFVPVALRATYTGKGRPMPAHDLSKAHMLQRSIGTLSA